MIESVSPAVDGVPDQFGSLGFAISLVTGSNEPPSSTVFDEIGIVVHDHLSPLSATDVEAESDMNLSADFPSGYPVGQVEMVDDVFC